MNVNSEAEANLPLFAWAASHSQGSVENINEIDLEPNPDAIDLKSESVSDWLNFSLASEEHEGNID